jgi:hypothetical protein
MGLTGWERGRNSALFLSIPSSSADAIAEPGNFKFTVSNMANFSGGGFYRSFINTPIRKYAIRYKKTSTHQL